MGTCSPSLPFTIVCCLSKVNQTQRPTSSASPGPEALRCIAWLIPVPLFFLIAQCHHSLRDGPLILQATGSPVTGNTPGSIWCARPLRLGCGFSELNPVLGGCQRWSPGCTQLLKPNDCCTGSDFSSPSHMCAPSPPPCSIHILSNCPYSPFAGFPRVQTQGHFFCQHPEHKEAAIPYSWTADLRKGQDPVFLHCIPGRTLGDLTGRPPRWSGPPGTAWFFPCTPLCPHITSQAFWL